MTERLFLHAGFSDFCVGWAKNDTWAYEYVGTEPITDKLFSALRPCMDGISWEDTEIYLVNGPGSTLGIRTFCAFIRTLLVLKKIKPSQVFVCDALHFAQLILTQRNLPQPVCARLNVTQTLCLNSLEDTFHVPSEAEQQQVLWLPHPCLSKEARVFHFEMKEILPLLFPQSPWGTTNAPDAFQTN
jgi:hypothetical protein